MINMRENIGVQIDFDAALKKLRVPEDLSDEFRDTFDECAAIANPRFIWTRCPVRKSGETTYIGDVPFESRIMSVNFEKATEAWPYIATCGRELYELALSTEDPLERYWVDGISEMYLRQAISAAYAEVTDISGAEKLFSMNPGSLADFPITNQKGLFALLGDVNKLIGVELTESCLMLPYKSGSGILFKSDKEFVNCSLCPRETCPSRRAPYDPMQFEERFGMAQCTIE